MSVSYPMGTVLSKKGRKVLVGGLSGFRCGTVAFMCSEEGPGGEELVCRGCPSRPPAIVSAPPEA